MKDISSLKKKLAGYSAMAGVMIAANHQASDAQVIYHDIDPDTLISNSNPMYQIDMNNDGIVDFVIRHNSYDAAFISCLNDNKVAIGAGTFSITAQSLGSCKNIPNSLYLTSQNWWAPNTSFSQNGIELLSSWGGGSFSPWEDAVHRFAPVILHLNDGNHYGWIRMTHSYYINLYAFFIEAYAYEAMPDSSLLTGCPTQVKGIDAPNLFNVFVQDQQLIIHFPQSPLPSQVIVLNEIGEKMTEQATTQSEMVMDVSYLAAGIYFVEVNDGEQRQVKKVVIAQ